MYKVLIGIFLASGLYGATCTVPAFTQAAIQTCLNSSGSGDTISLPAGTYNVSSALTMPAHPITLTGVRAKSIINWSSPTDYVMAIGDGQTVQNLVLTAGVAIEGSGAHFSYNVCLNVGTIMCVRDNGAQNETVDHNIMTWTTVCTALCTVDRLFYKTDHPSPNNVTVSFNYIDGYWEGIGFGGFNAGVTGSNVNVLNNVLLHGYRMAIEDGTPIAGHHIDNNYVNNFTTGGSTSLDTTCGAPNVNGNYDCNSFGISMAGGGSSGATINNNRMYGAGAGAGWDGAITSWGIEMTALAGQLTVSGNTIQTFNYGIWDDADSGNTTANRVAVTNNHLCNITQSGQRAVGWGTGNTYAASCPAADPVPCPPFDLTTGGVPSGCGGDPFTSAISGFTLLSDYEFGTGGNVTNTTDLGAHFDPYGIAGTNPINLEWQRYQTFGFNSPSPFIFTANSLKLTATATALNDGGISSGQIWTKDMLQPGVTGYAVYAVEGYIKIPAGKGMWPAFWLYTKTPDVNDDSEIDLFEFFEGEPGVDSTMMSSNMHGPGVGSQPFSLFNGSGFYVPGFDFAAGLHKIQMVWTTSTVDKYVDGVKVQTTNFAWTSGGAAQIGINLAVGTSVSWAVGMQPNSFAEFPASVEVGHLKIWGGGAAACTPGTITPYININGTGWFSSFTASVAPGNLVDLGPQPLTGSWAWTGPSGFTSTSRWLQSIPLRTGANTFTSTYTDTGICPTPGNFVLTIAQTGPAVY